MPSGESTLIGTDPGSDGPVRDATTAPRAGSADAPRRTTTRIDEGPAPRRLPRRIYLRATLGLFAIALLMTGVLYAQHVLSAWLHGRVAYQIDFASISLNPPVPAWFRGGSPAFLERFRIEAGYPTRIGLLDLDLGLFQKALSKDPWVARVDRLERKHPDRLIVQLAYRRPVASARVATPEGIKAYLLDAEGVILRGEDVDRDFAGRLTALQGLSPPVDPRPGLPWHLADARDVPRPDSRVAQGTRLAAFLSGHLEQTTESRPFDRVEAINPTHDPERGIWVRPSAETWVLWGSPVDHEAPGELPAEDKWRVLVETARSHGGLTLPKGQFWQFVKSKLEARQSPDP